MSDEKLADFLKTGKDWSRLRASVPSVYVVKLPPYRSSPARLVVELNPVDETGTPKKSARANSPIESWIQRDLGHVCSIIIET
ncbi:MAG: hypothetical protein ABSF24_12155 [Candidatus Bathyarchaeia archaeon]